MFNEASLCPATELPWPLLSQPHPRAPDVSRGQVLMGNSTRNIEDAPYPCPSPSFQPFPSCCPSPIISTSLHIFLSPMLFSNHYSCFASIVSHPPSSPQPLLRLVPAATPSSPLHTHGTLRFPFKQTLEDWSGGGRLAVLGCWPSERYEKNWFSCSFIIERRLCVSVLEASVNT
ncbi:hypothetical protein E2C01_072692 [Portunus trituberculatus]|uniref:Uncharacterized protein n=1 Tax=Portunus trituberculatus TaxID=210409 RepID=A0A5B7I0Q1_PORTR|nr:hypothetical protein [Portunus trituberculatus]